MCAEPSYPESLGFCFCYAGLQDFTFSACGRQGRAHRLLLNSGDLAAERFDSPLKHGSPRSFPRICGGHAIVFCFQFGEVFLEPPEHLVIHQVGADIESQRVVSGHQTLEFCLELLRLGQTLFFLPYHVRDIGHSTIVGHEDAANESWGFQVNDTFASWGQKQIYHGFLKPLEKFLLRTPLVPWSYLASNVYYNTFWYRFVGRKRAEEMLQTPWGQLFREAY